MSTSYRPAETRYSGASYRRGGSHPAAWDKRSASKSETTLSFTPKTPITGLIYYVDTTSKPDSSRL